MNFANRNSSLRTAVWRRLPVEWREQPGAERPIFLAPQCPTSDRARLRRTPIRLPFFGSTESRPAARDGFAFTPARRPHRAFTILELMIVIGIIGLMAAMALPHLAGFTKGSAMTAATRQLLDDVGLARQRALVNRSEVDMVFLPPEFWINNGTNNTGVMNLSSVQVTNLISHQCAAYALISTRTVGDQPGVFNVHYLTDWKYLPQGVYIFPFLITNSSYPYPTVSVTNTLTSTTNSWTILTYTNRSFPFPSTYNGTNNLLPYIGFAPNGQLTTNGDQFILLTSGSIFFSTGPNGLPVFATPSVVETPPGNATNNPNIIHIDWLTGRARLERNQF